MTGCRLPGPRPGRPSSRRAFSSHRQISGVEHQRCALRRHVRSEQPLISAGPSPGRGGITRTQYAIKVEIIAMPVRASYKTKLHPTPTPNGHILSGNWGLVDRFFVWITTYSGVSMSSPGTWIQQGSSLGRKSGGAPWRCNPLGSPSGRVRPAARRFAGSFLLAGVGESDRRTAELAGLAALQRHCLA